MSSPKSTGNSPACGNSQHFVATNRGAFECAKEAISAKINKNEAAVVALAATTYRGWAAYQPVQAAPAAAFSCR